MNDSTRRPRVLVTGATGTLGSALVAALAPSCAVTASARNAPRARALHERCGCALQLGDLRDAGFVETLLGRGEFDAVFHLAGTSHDTLLGRVSAANWSETLSVNLDASFLLTRAALRHLPRGGRLVLVSSRVGERGGRGQSAYAASKSALLALMKTAALEGAAREVRVNAVCPGFAPSALSQQLSPAMLAARAAENLLPGADATQSFVALCLWLLHANVTGQTLRPDCR